MTNATDNAITEAAARAAFTVNDDGSLRYGLRTVRDALGRDPHASTPSNLADDALRAYTNGRPALAALLYLAAALASAGMSRTLMYEDSARRMAAAADAVAKSKARDPLADALADYLALAERWNAGALNRSAEQSHDLDGKMHDKLTRACDLAAERDDANVSESLASLIAYATPTDAAIASRLVADALALGYLVSVRDSMDADGEWTVKRSRDVLAILGALATTGSDTVAMRTPDGTPAATFFLIYGNGPGETIADSSLGPVTETIAAGAQALADRYAERAQ